MEEDPLNTLEEKLKPPSNSKTSMVLNGIGNGMMLGGIPVILYNMMHEVTNGKVGKGFFQSNKLGGKVGVFTTVTGSLLGAVYGWHEANRTQEYRDNVAGEIIKIRNQVDANTKLIRSWSEKEKAQGEKATAAAEISR